MNRFDGILAPVVTPFRKDLTPDKDRFLNHCQWISSKGVNLAVFGTNSEANSLSVKEKIELLEFLIFSGITGESLMPGSGCCSISDTVELTKFAITIGCRGVLMLPPFFYKGVSDEGLYAYYAEIIEQVNEDNLAIYLYHIPPISQVPLSTDLVKRLATEYPDNIAGIKDSSGDWKQTAAFNDMNIPNFRVFCGSESFLLKNMRAGGAGCISATANVNALAINNLFKSWDSERAESLQENIDQVRNIFQSYPMIPALKTAITLQSRDEGWSRVRPPLTTLTKDQIGALSDELSTAGFTMDGITRHA